MVGNVSLNARIMSSTHANAGIVLQVHVTDAAITAVVGLINTSTIRLTHNMSTG